MLKRIKVNSLIKKAKLPRHEAEAVLSHILRRNRLEIYLDDSRLSLGQYFKFNRISRKRLKGKPLQYLLGKIEFYGLPLKLNKHVFIPRPETEVLVDTVISRYKFYHGKLKILDLCTGSGNIAISLAKKIENCRIYASDISLKALAVARRNAKLNKVGAKVEFIRSDLFENIKDKFDVITINPPYIPLLEIKNLGKELRYEPSIALNGGIDGMDFYYRIFEEITKVMKPHSAAFFEVGDNQAEQLEKVISLSKHLKLLHVINDYNNRARVLEVEKI